MAFSVILKLLPCIGGSSAAPEEESSIRPRPRRPSNPMVIEYKPAYERASQERAVPPPSSTDGDASGSDDALPSEEDGPRADEGDVCVPARIADALKVEKSKHAVEAWLEQQDALLKEQQERYVHAQSDAESHTVGSHAGHGGDDATSPDDDATSSDDDATSSDDDATSPDDDATSSDDDQATLLAVPLERPVRHRLTIDSLREVARSVRGSTAMAARSVNRRFTVDSLRGSSAPEMQGPNEKAARVLDIYGTESSRVDNGIGSSRAQKSIGRSRAHKTSFFARIFRRKVNAQAGDREKKRRSLFDCPDCGDELVEHVMKATAALEGLVAHSQRMATIDIYRVNDPDVLTGAYRACLDQLTARMEIEQSILRTALSLSHQVLRDADEQIRPNKAMTAPCRRLPR
ncbi:uncharacterized protein SCHCODRAFT_01165265 [Schizophyllum commune H4-8]|nr:uncharacterized protein SCHCODRAFT_01165265 [Schizophyllum commune H4-8]KAI5897259.1 hypothetical protein SCHCODRAFT_01165265 [Schizophyllum commune H4-8]